MLGSIVGLVLIDKLNPKNKKLFILNIYSTMKKAVLLSLLFFLIYACKSENNVCKYLPFVIAGSTKFWTKELYVFTSI